MKVCRELPCGSRTSYFDLGPRHEESGGGGGEGGEEIEMGGPLILMLSIE